LLDYTVIQDLRNEIRGELLTPTDVGYDPARRVWNGMINKRPALIVQCATVADVVACTNFAREHDVLVSVRGGGHNYAGKAVCDEGLVIDLSRMKTISVDPVRRTAVAEAGLRLGEFDRATQDYGLATTLGVNTDTGISGLTLGGGYGWLAGKYGLACDNLIWAEVVTADGGILECSADQNTDLFWGLRGAGANFGVVTKLQYKLHPISKVVGGLIIHPMNEEVLRFFDEFSAEAPDELTTLGAVLTDQNGNPAFGTLVCYCGAETKEGEKVLEPLRKFEKPLADFIKPLTYLEMQTQLDATWPPGRHYYNKAHNIRRLNNGAIRTILHYASILPTSVSNIALQQMHGAAGRVPSSDTAFPHRYNHFELYVHPATDDPAQDDKIINWARECWRDMQPFVERSVYVNALEDAAEEGEPRVREAYGANYERLAALKRKYDPTNLFRQNSNIKPAHL
jgi:FAD/FMN-containing dehydrogenase